MLTISWNSCIFSFAFVNILKLVCLFCSMKKVSVSYEDGRPVEGKGAGRKVIDKVHETYRSDLADKDFAYDGEKSLFTVGPLPRNKLEFTVVLDDVSAERWMCWVLLIDFFPIIA